MFLNHWLYKETPYIDITNLSEFYQLSQEFDRMKDLIQIYQNKYFINANSRVNQVLKEKIKEKNYNLKNEDKIYSQIISITFNNINDDTYTQFLKNKDNLYPYFIDQDIESINLKTTKHIKQKGIDFYLNKNEKTATLSECTAKKIPDSVVYNSEEYIVTSISSLCFKKASFSHLDLSQNKLLRVIADNAFTSSRIKEITLPPSVVCIGKSAFSNTKLLTKVNIPENSQLKLIEEDAFDQSSIKSLIIPSSVIELKECWCKNTPNLTDIKVLPNNKYFSNYDDNNFIIGKTYVENSQFDILVFCNRDVNEVTIPSFIKKIEPYAFNDCKNLKKVIFTENSDLRLIEKFAFYKTSIEEILIPPKTIKIGEKCFFNCINMKKIDFMKNSELKTIEEEAFSITKIEEIFIQSSVDDLKKDCFKGSNLNEINVSQNNKLYSSYNKELVFQMNALIYVTPNLEIVEIPPFINKISPYTFYKSKVKKIKFLGKSKLQIIGVRAFYQSKIEEIFIPSHVTHIKEESFALCKELKKIEFSKDSELTFIDDNSELKYIQKCAFRDAGIKKITLPSSLIYLSEYCFNECFQLEEANFPSNSKLQSIESSVFEFSSLKFFSIPSSVVELKNNWCYEKIEVTVMPNNKMFTNYEDKFIIGKSCIESDIFDVLVLCHINVEYAKIPSFIKKIRSDAFGMRAKLKTVEFKKDSNVTVIENNSFHLSSLVTINIPPRVTKISFCAFFMCDKLKIINFSEDSELKLIEENAFLESSIDSFLIPSHVIKIEKIAFFCMNLKIIEIAENSELISFAPNSFFYYMPNIIMMPANLCNKSHIKKWMNNFNYNF